MSSADAAHSEPRLLILGTAGHIDHGKSSLVRALTGTDPDRLPEEKARGMTIELGFAHLDLSAPPGDADTRAVRLGIVDVPGHERFIRTMVSGATGIDLAMLVVAADDGVMPQTREHAEILDLLGLRTGVVAINKVDLVDDDRAESVAEHVRQLTEGLSSGDWPIVCVSAASGRGLDELRHTLRLTALAAPQRRASAIFRLAIDRVFAVQGRGTVVTGSVLSGAAQAGTALELHPGARPCKVRELQSHGQSAANVRAGQRAALNLTGVDRETIERGMELATPGCLTASRHVDARLRILSRRARPLASFNRGRVEAATWEQIATVVALDGDEMQPGTAGLVQLRFRTPVVAAHGQRFIVRDENAQATIGGGVILRPVSRRMTRKATDDIGGLKELESADAARRVAEVLRHAGFEPVRDEALACRAGIEPAEAAASRAALKRDGVLTSPVGGADVHADVVRALRGRTMAMLRRFHESSPGAAGLPVERVVGWIERRSAAGIGRALFAALTAEGELVVRGPFVSHRSHRPALSPEDDKLLESLIGELQAAGLDPPAWDKLKCVAGLSKPRQARLLNLARGDARVVLIAPQHFASAEAVDTFKRAVSELATDGQRFTLAQVRDRLKLSRRAVQPMLEYLDRIQFTRRIGDERVRVGS
ncbi:MAG: selenocysteine-specific translation elongation factor [Phycisphaerae bacterium]|nr:selenocysteine-specific translation elongation factor [Phycisphaerae bacterium]NUQ45526.1 selenocysteine-specific translation elongation factor [Phycisphaerae bacterium]